MDNSRPAFPVVCQDMSKYQVCESGMSLRDWFAGLALQGIASVLHDGIRPEDLLLMAQACYLIADLMLAEREKKLTSEV